MPFRGCSAHCSPRGLRPEQVRWIVVTHAHLDHAGGAGALLARCPERHAASRTLARRVTSSTPSRLVASATQVYGETRFAELYGRIDPIPQERVRALEDGATFELGGATLRVHHTAGHAKHHFVVDNPARPDSLYRGRVRARLPRIAAWRPLRACLDQPDGLRRGGGAPEHRAHPCPRARRPRASPTTTRSRTSAKSASQLRAWIDRSEAWLEQAAESDGARSRR